MIKSNIDMRPTSLGLKVGDLVEVRSAEEILTSLNDRGEFENLPFMPEILERFVRPFDFYPRAVAEGQQWQKDKGIPPSREEALVETYKRPRSGEPPDVEPARVYFENAFFNPKRYGLTRVGRYKLDRRLHPEVEKLEKILGLELDTPEPGQGVLSQAEMLAAASYMLHLANGVAITASTTTSTSRIAASVRSLS